MNSPSHPKPRNGASEFVLEGIPLSIDWTYEPGDASTGTGPGFELRDVRQADGLSLWDFLDCLKALETLRVILLNHLLNNTQELE